MRMIFFFREVLLHHFHIHFHFPHFHFHHEIKKVFLRKFFFCTTFTFSKMQNFFFPASFLTTPLGFTFLPRNNFLVATFSISLSPRCQHQHFPLNQQQYKGVHFQNNVHSASHFLSAILNLTLLSSINLNSAS